MLPVVLSIAGSDSGGGAGIQADLKTFHAFHTFGTTAITAVTVQNTLGVSGFHAIPLETVREQIAAVVSDLRPAACKTGMLATAELAAVVAEAIRSGGLTRYVLDPVMVATSGDRLLERAAEQTIIEQLLPLATVVTPNLDEATILTGRSVRGPEEMARAAEDLVSLGAGAALVKGGHLRGGEVVDILHDGHTFREWRRTRLETRSTHGTGCTLSAAIAAGLGWGRPLEETVDDALEYVHQALIHAPGLGSGHGPLNHLVPGREPSSAAASNPPPGIRRSDPAP